MGTNLSYRPKFDAGDLVWYIGRVCEIAPGGRYDSEAAGGVPFIPEHMLYELYHDGGKTLHGVPEPDLRGLTWDEFKWYLDPQTGKRKIGKNRAWPIIAAQTIGGMIAGASLGFLLATGDWWNLAGVVVGALPWAVIHMGTRANWKGRQM